MAFRFAFYSSNDAPLRRASGVKRSNALLLGKMSTYGNYALMHNAH